MAASSLNILCENSNPVKIYGNKKYDCFCLKSIGKIHMGLNFFWPYMQFMYYIVKELFI